MKLVIFGAVALVVGLAGGTGARVFTAPALPAGADSLIAVADSVYHAKKALGSESHGEAAVAQAAPHDAHDATTEAHGVAAPGGEGHGDVTVAAGPPALAASPAAAHAAAPVVPEGPSPERYKQVGNILLAMKPVDAAQVIGYLDDRQVHGLLEAMGPRQAAQILTQLPAERAATLSRRLLATPAREAR